MFCQKCGSEIPVNSNECPNCQTVLPPPVQIKSYLAQSIIVTLCCCIPFGIVAIVYAARVSGLVAVGDIAGAQAASRKANMWSWIAFGCGLVVGLLQIAVQVLSVILDNAVQ